MSVLSDFLAKRDTVKVIPANTTADAAVERVVESALSKFLGKAVAEAKRAEEIANLPVVVRPPEWVPVQDYGEPDDVVNSDATPPSDDLAETMTDEEILESLGVVVDPYNDQYGSQLTQYLNEEYVRELYESAGEVLSSGEARESYEYDEDGQPIPTEEERRNYIGIPLENESGLRMPFPLDESQVRAIDELLDKQYGCLIGAAGTGKTTVTKELVHRLFYDPNSTFHPERSGNRFNIAFVAFTGMATQVIKANLPTWLHGCVKTIHGLLEFAPKEVILTDKKTGQPKVSKIFAPRRDEDNKLYENVIVIDEASMLGLDLWNQLRVACMAGTRIIMIGDLNQLPPIFGDPIFAYALGQWHVSLLTHIHRQTGSAGRIIDAAHAILNGKINELHFESMKGNADWRVIGAKIDQRAGKAHQELLATVNNLRKLKFPDGSMVYDPFRDRIMTSGNGYGLDGTERESDQIQQAPINDVLAQLIQPPTDDNPRYIIDAGRVHRHFAVGNRVMATKNEPPSVTDRVTNGMTGIIREIIANGEYAGERHKFGPEQEVRAYLRKKMGLALEISSPDSESEKTKDLASLQDGDIDLDALSSDLAERLSQAETDEELEQADSQNWASHSITVEFANGAIRKFWSKQQAESIQLAYASTVAKCQGSQFPTAVIIVHHASKQQLCREWLYTAVTRAQEHVIILYTELGLRCCFAKQKIKGATLAEKIARYQEFYEGVPGLTGGLMRKNIVLEVG
jgi:ATP-dependent exoDNAse (exonuclease V) alpha subunit